MNGFRISLRRGLLAVALVATCAAAASAQSWKSQHVISARAGAINYVAGEAKFKGLGKTEWSRLTMDDTLMSGDTVLTGAGAQVEVLLNPGSYLRLGENTEFTLADDSLDNLRLEITRGSAVVEAVGFDQLKVSILIDTPHTRVAVIRSGLYRVNVRETNVTEVAVFKGRATVGRGTEPLTLKGGRAARAGGAGVELVELDKKQKDSLDLWSRERGRELAKLNQKLSRREVNAIFAGMDWQSVWPTANNGSFWFFNRATRCWILLPGGGGYWSWVSPYGHRYGYNIYFVGSENFGNGRCPTCNGANPPNPHAVIGNGNHGNNGGGNVVIGPGGGYGNNNNGGGSNNGGGYVAPPPSPPREFVRPSMDAPRPMPAERSSSPGPVRTTRDQ
ncbi:MAG TPA: FecR family protein [Pyrinomonadaceae bacterium]|nr:FecR family protein [Pyrinomonadaceae bacterium]